MTPVPTQRIDSSNKSGNNQKIRDLNRFWSKVDKRGPDECWEWTVSRRTGGYGVFWTGKKLVSAHRFSYELNTGTKIPEGLQVNHHCDNRACVNPRHLYLGTQKDNMLDCFHRGRSSLKTYRGEEHGSSTISKREAIKIRKLADEGGFYQREIAEMFGVSRQLVSEIKRRRLWKHIQ